MENHVPGWLGLVLCFWEEASILFFEGCGGLGKNEESMMRERESEWARRRDLSRLFACR
jgi:hypothetical protein